LFAFYACTFITKIRLYWYSIFDVDTDMIGIYLDTKWQLSNKYK